MELIEPTYNKLFHFYSPVIKLVTYNLPDIIP